MGAGEFCKGMSLSGKADTWKAHSVSNQMGLGVLGRWSLPGEKIMGSMSKEVRDGLEGRKCWSRKPSVQARVNWRITAQGSTPASSLAATPHTLSLL